MKKWLELLSTAWISIARHKLRSFLTILGVVIGVSAVITLMSIGRGTSVNILSRLESMGSNLLFVQPGFTMSAGVRTGPGSATTLTLEDAVAIAMEVPDIKAVAPSSSTSLQVIAGDQNMRAAITGISLEYQDAYDLKMAEGDFLTQEDYDGAARVAVLGPMVKETLFPGGDSPVGQEIRLGTTVATVIGVLQSKGESMQSTDRAILIPLTTLQQMVAQSRTSTGEHVIGSITVSAADKRHIEAVKNNITALLQVRHNIEPGAANDFTVTSMQDLANALTQAANSLSLLLGAIAGISLLVGGIGVMNIMLVSVVERTREIGIRKALGARERDIWGQFVVEASFLTLIGGLLGVTAGWAAALLVSRLSSMNTLVTADIILLALSVSIGIGLFFGFYPAWQASRLDPIRALRAE